jgi:hypothetical protein
MLTNDDIKKMGEVFPTRTDLEGQTKELKAYSNNQTDQIGRMINNAFQDQKDYMESRFNKIEEELDLRSAFQNLERRIEKLEAKQRN